MWVFFLYLIDCIYFPNQHVTLFVHYVMMWNVTICFVNGYEIISYYSTAALSHICESCCLLLTSKIYDFTSWGGPPECTISFGLWPGHLNFGKSCRLSREFWSSEIQSICGAYPLKESAAELRRSYLDCLGFHQLLLFLVNISSVRQVKSRNWFALLHVGTSHSSFRFSSVTYRLISDKIASR